ncbi:hypothetical protein TYRP_009479 [Tyrophagus putrescentiae]|nr:hypothetical protein TYRP_009479 [Tyrophagus putrescentiae]
MSEPQIAGTSSTSEPTASTSSTSADAGCSPATTTTNNGGEFLSTGRTGRRNALGDILDANTAFLSTADLPDQLSALSFGSDQCGPSTSTGGGGLYSAGPSTSSNPPQ